MQLAKNSYSKATQGLRRDVFGRFHRGIWVITVIQFFTAFGVSICLPFLSLYLYQERGLSMTMVGIMFLAAGLCSAAMQMVGGMLADRIGRRPLLLGATGISIILYSALAILIGVSAPVWAIMAVFITSWTTLTMIFPAIRAMVADLSPKNRLTETYGLLRVGGNIGFAAGPAVAGYLMTLLPYAWLLGVAALACIFAFLLILSGLRESYRGGAERIDFRSTFSVATNRSFLMFTILSTLVFLSMGQLFSTLSVFTVDYLGFSTAQYGMLLTANGIIVALSLYPVAWAVNRLSRASGLILGSLLYALGWLTMSWVADFNWAFVTITVVTAAEVVFTPLALSVVAEFSPEDKRGRYMGFFGLSQTLGISFGPLLGGVLLDAFPADPLFIWGTIASVAFITAVGFYWWGKTRPINQV